MGANSQVLEAHGVEFYSLDGLAKRWLTSRRNLYRKVEEGRLRVIRLGPLIRVPAGEVARVDANGFDLK